MDKFLWQGVVSAGAIKTKGPGGKGQVDIAAPEIDHVSELLTWTLELGQQTLMEDLPGKGTGLGGNAGETKRNKA